MLLHNDTQFTVHITRAMYSVSGIIIIVLYFLLKKSVTGEKVPYSKMLSPVFERLRAH